MLVRSAIFARAVRYARSTSNRLDERAPLLPPQMNCGKRPPETSTDEAIGVAGRAGGADGVWPCRCHGVALPARASAMVTNERVIGEEREPPAVGRRDHCGASMIARG